MDVNIKKVMAGRENGTKTEVKLLLTGGGTFTQLLSVIQSHDVTLAETRWMTESSSLNSHSFDYNCCQRTTGPISIL